MSLASEIDDWLILHEKRDSPQLVTRRREVLGMLESLACQMLQVECGLTMSTTDMATGRYVDRLWATIQYHSQGPPGREKVPFEEVIRRIEKGTDGQGDVSVLKDVLLAQALEMGEANAAEVFQQKYDPYVRAVAAKVGGPSSVEAVENLVAALILPRDGQRSRLATFVGKTSLKSWLRTVVVRECCAWGRGKREVAAEHLQEIADDCDHTVEIANRQCEQLLRPAFRMAVDSVSTKDRVLLKMLLLDGVPQKQLASSLGISPGTLTRRKQQAGRRIWSAIQESANQSSRPEAVADCLNQTVGGDSREMQMRLADILATEIIRGSNDCREAER